MPSIFYLSWIKKRKTKNNCLQTSGNCHPKSILALEIVVGEKNFDLLLSILEREISQQFQVSCFACTQFIRSIWDTRGRRISPLVGILRLRKWPKRLYFPLSSEAVSNRYCRTCSDLFTISVNVSVGKFLLLQWPWQCYQKFTASEEKYLDSSESLGYEKTFWINNTSVLVTGMPKTWGNPKHCDNDSSPIFLWAM